jgi:hypothetical protein
VHATHLPPELPANLWMTSPESALEEAVGAARSELGALAASVPPELFAGVARSDRDRLAGALRDRA